MDDNYRIVGFIRRRWVILVAGFLLIVILGYISGHGFINVEVSGATLGDINYKITNQKSQKTVYIKTKSTKISRFLPKGNYEVSASSTEKSLVSVTDTKGFLTTTKVQASLSPEKKRSFVGNSPLSCMYLAANSLYSYYCGDLYSNITEHFSTTATSAAYSSKNKNTATAGAVEGTATVGDKTFVLLNVPPIEGSAKPAHTIYMAGDNFSLVNPVSLSDLDNQKSYKITNFQQGVLLYSSDLSDIVSYGPSFSSPKHIKLPEVKDNTLQGLLVGSNKTTLVVARSNRIATESNNDPKAKLGNVKTQIDVYKDGAWKSLLLSQKLDDHFAEVEPCGYSSVCLITNQIMYVYDVSSKKPKLKFTLTDSKHLVPAGGQLLIVRSGGILDMDIDHQTGYIEYAFGGYKYCGLQDGTENGYVLCVKNPDDKSFALYIDRSRDNTDSLDKKLLDLQGNALVKKLPYIGAGFEYRLDYGPPLSSDPAQPILYIQAKTAQGQKDALDWIHYGGYDISKFRVVTSPGE